MGCCCEGIAVGIGLVGEILGRHGGLWWFVGDWAGRVASCLLVDVVQLHNNEILVQFYV